jgi:hypothetical protein
MIKKCHLLDHGIPRISNTVSRSAAIPKAATVSGGVAARKWSVSDYKKELKC